MIKIERGVAPVTTQLWTPGLILGVFFYVLAVLFLYWLGKETGKNHAPCLLLQTSGVRCPLCGGTSACISLITGNPLLALQHNPMVALGVPLFAVYLVLRYLFRKRVVFILPRPLFVCGIVALVAINWAYVLSQDTKSHEHSPPVGRELLHRLLQR